MKKSNYRISINGMSCFRETREEAIAFAKTADEDSAVKVFDSFNHVIWEN